MVCAKLQIVTFWLQILRFFGFSIDTAYFSCHAGKKSSGGS